MLKSVICVPCEVVPCLREMNICEFFQFPSSLSSGFHSLISLSDASMSLNSEFDDLCLIARWRWHKRTRVSII